MKLAPGHYVVTFDPKGELYMGHGMRARIVASDQRKPTASERQRVLIAILAAFARGA